MRLFIVGALILAAAFIMRRFVGSREDSGDFFTAEPMGYAAIVVGVIGIVMMAVGVIRW